MLPAQIQDVTQNDRRCKAHSYVSDDACNDSVFLFYVVKTSRNREEIGRHANSVFPIHDLTQYYKMEKSIINIQQQFVVI